MSKPPVDPGCPIFDEEGNVRTDEHGRVIAHSEARRAVVYNKNGSRVNDTVSINVHAWKVAAGFVGALATIVVTTWTTVVWVAAPHFREAIAVQDAPIRKDVDAQRERMNEHLLAEAERAQSFPTREDLRDTQLEIKASLDRLEAQIIELRRNR